MKCKIEGCKNPVWGNRLCANHKPRKPLPQCRIKPSLTTKKVVNDGKSIQMKQFFLEIWKKRKHYSEVSGKYLGQEAMSTYFHHILPKSKYPEACFDEENIILLTLSEHDQVEMDMYRYEEVNIRRKYLLKKYERS